MEDKIYRALVVEEAGDKTFSRKIQNKSIRDLPEGNLIVRVKYSSLNYKDALSATGNRGVTRTYPHVPGIDAAGTVEESDDENFKPGERVIVTSYDLGMNTPGGFGQYISVPSMWAVKLPQSLTLKESMVFGTAGFTAGLSIHALTASVSPERGEILVTGATGGVGSLSVAILSRLGFSVSAVTGKPEKHNFLTSLGAKHILERKAVTNKSEAPMLKGQWAGVIDTVGGPMLAAAIKATKLHGIVTCCGNVASHELPLNVYPFILRGISLVGIDSQNCPSDLRKEIWGKLANEWKFEQLANIYTEISLEDVSRHIDMILKGALAGRIIVNLDT